MIDVNLINGMALAFEGDAVYSMYIRRHLILKGMTKPNKLHQEATKYVSAKAQARLISLMLEEQVLTEKEEEIYKRGRNTNSHTKAKNADVVTYRMSTGFEAVMGYLHLTENMERLETLISWCIQKVEEQKLQARMAAELGPFGHRVFTDSAPVLEAELAARSGQGWRGKHTLVLSRDAGSMFFLGEIYVDIALPPSEPVTHHCGTCTACMDACPTGAIIAPHRLDARRCISYLTIELHGAIPEDMRPLIGNRIYGCDDCQRVCPWNKYAHVSALPDFDEREGLTDAPLTALLAWSEEEFLRRTEGSPIRRIGHARWLRNVAVALGNALARLPADDPARAPLLAALAARREHPDEMVREHVAWAMEQKA